MNRPRMYRGPHPARAALSPARPAARTRARWGGPDRAASRLQPRRLASLGRNSHADRAVVRTPIHEVGPELLRDEALVCVHGGGADGRHAARMREEAAEERMGIVGEA